MRSKLHLVASLLLSVAGLNAADTTNVPVKGLGNGRLQIGLITIDSGARTISIPASVNMTAGLVEYALVTTWGKIHESVFKTDASPAHIHAACLLLGAKFETNIESAVFFDPKREIPGAKLKIDVFVPGANLRTNAIDAFLVNAKEKERKQNFVPYWIYNGSRFSDGRFLADREGSIISLIADPAALINNPRHDRENDELWSANTPEIPPVDTRVEIRLTFSETNAIQR